MLYTAGICVQYSGKAAPLSLLLVSFMLYFFRFVYAEVVTAMPVNGGSYNALLNTTSKRFAALASCLSMLSYVATAVVSAYSAIAYIQPLWAWAATPEGTNIGTVSLLGFFALLTLIGIGESAAVALFMFALHVTALTIVSGYALAFAVADNWVIFRANLATPFPDVLTSTGDLVATGTWGTALFYGYAAALLGITGFETAANYVEEMAGAHTYVATLRNMWLAAGFFNPLVAVLAMAVLPMDDMYANSSNLLAEMAVKAGGKGLQTFLCIDGFIVLAGSVLTAYVGITGLVRRLALDRCLPGFLGAENRLRGTNHWIILSFFGLTASLFLLLAGVSGASPASQMDNLSGVYDMAFLSVMTAFALSCMILKWKRPDLPRLVITSWPTVFTALAFVLTGLVGNVLKGPEVLPWFFAYFGAVLLVVLVMFERTRLLRAALFVARKVLADSRSRKRAQVQLDALQAAHSRLEEARRTRRASSGGNALAMSFGDVEDDGGDGVHHRGASGAGEHAPAHGDYAGSDAGGKVSSGGFLARILALVGLGSPAEEEGEADGEGYGVLGGGAKDGLLGRGGGGDDGGDGEYGADAGGASSGSADYEADESYAGSDWRSAVLRGIVARIGEINERPIVFFAKDGGDLATLNKAVLYVRDNEQTQRLVIVHVVDDRAALGELLGGAGGSGAGSIGSPLPSPSAASEGGIGFSIGRQISAPSLLTASGGAAAVPDAAAAEALLSRLPPPPPSVRLLLDNVALLDAVYPKLRIDCLVVRGSFFCPPVVGWLGRHLGIAPNMMFMAMPDDRFPHQFAALGGVRVVTRSGSPAARLAQADHLREVLARVSTDVAALLSSAEEGEGGAAAAGTATGAAFVASHGVRGARGHGQATAVGS